VVPASGDTGRCSCIADGAFTGRRTQVYTTAPSVRESGRCGDFHITNRLLLVPGRCDDRSCGRGKTRPCSCKPVCVADGVATAQPTHYANQRWPTQNTNGTSANRYYNNLLPWRVFRHAKSNTQQATNRDGAQYGSPVSHFLRGQLQRDRCDCVLQVSGLVRLRSCGDRRLGASTPARASPATLRVLRHSLAVHTRLSALPCAIQALPTIAPDARRLRSTAASAARQRTPRMTPTPWSRHSGSISPPPRGTAGCSALHGNELRPACFCDVYSAWELPRPWTTLRCSAPCRAHHIVSAPGLLNRCSVQR